MPKEFLITVYLFTHLENYNSGWYVFKERDKCEGAYIIKSGEF